MSAPVKVGDRVRVRVEKHGYPAGDKGTVRRVANLVGTLVYYYLVAMDRDGSGTTRVVFNADEIEPDV